MVVPRKTMRHAFPAVIPKSTCLGLRGIPPGLAQVEPFSSSRPPALEAILPLFPGTRLSALVRFTVKNTVLFFLVIVQTRFFPLFFLARSKINKAYSFCISE